jgi:cyclic pyranopterin monophosphate synthase
MVSISEKPITARRAVAGASVRMRRATLALLAGGATKKGDVMATARIAGIQAAKRTWELIPLCHPIALTGVEVDLRSEADEGSGVGTVRIEATVDAFDRTGAEMEALVAANIAALTIYDMLKSVDRWMTITDVGLLEKSGGRSGHLQKTPRSLTPSGVSKGLRRSKNSP